jgi:hypothetical protein
LRTLWALKTRSSVKGQRPPLASVADMQAMSLERAVIAPAAEE